MKQIYPDWVIKHKRKGTAIHRIRGKYYLYEVTSKWDKRLKRARKITKSYIGRITPDGLHKPEYRIKQATTCKECGASLFLVRENKEIVERLKKYFPVRWKEIFVLSVLRLLYRSPLKHMGFYYQDSWLSEEYKEASLSKNSIHQILESTGREREAIVEFLRSFNSGCENLLIDITHIFSSSGGMFLAEKGYNREFDFSPQVNLLFIFSYDQRLPIFYRILPGNVRDVSTLKVSIEESGVRDVVIIGDKGFYSDSNRELLNREGLRYILPLKRNNSLIDYEILKVGQKRGFEGYFKYRDRYIWYYRRMCKGFDVWIYLDERLKREEEQDYLDKIETHPEFGYTIDRFYDRQHMFGTISLITNLEEVTPQKVYEYYKSRVGIEQMFDSFKNTVEADRSYMRSDYSLEGWMFINYLSLVYYYKIYQVLIKKELLREYSPCDVLLYLSRYRRTKVSTHWIDLEIPKQTKKVMKIFDLLT